MRLDVLGRALQTAAQAPSAERLAEAVRAQERLEAHERFKDEELHTVQRAEMALRLLAWLCSDQSALEPFPIDPEYAPIERLGRWYVEEGGFVDWARRVARGSDRTLFDQGIHAVVALADERRRQLDQRFAAALPRWLAAKRPSAQVVPIEDVSKRVIARFLDEREKRRLLVLLLDGMAWAQAVEILLSLEDQPEHWGPIAWYAGRKGVGDSAYPVVLAALPTVTEISRSAFFAGKLMTSSQPAGGSIRSCFLEANVLAPRVSALASRQQAYRSTERVQDDPCGMSLRDVCASTASYGMVGLCKRTSASMRDFTLSGQPQKTYVVVLDKGDEATRRRTAY